MNILSRFCFQLTQARQSSVKPIHKSMAGMIEPYEIQVENAVHQLIKLGLIARSNLNVQVSDSLLETGYVLEDTTFDLAGIQVVEENSSAIAVISQSHVIELCDLTDQFGFYGFAAWLTRAGHVVPLESVRTSELFKKANAYIDRIHSIFPHVVYIADVSTAYRALQNTSDGIDGKILP